AAEKQRDQRQTDMPLSDDRPATRCSDWNTQKSTHRGFETGNLQSQEGLLGDDTQGERRRKRMSRTEGPNVSDTRSALSTGSPPGRAGENVHRLTVSSAGARSAAGPETARAPLTCPRLSSTT